MIHRRRLVVALVAATILLGGLSVLWRSALERGVSTADEPFRVALTDLPAGPAQRKAPASILIVLLDDVGFTDVESISLPNIDRLAARGWSTSRGYAMPLCSTSRYCLTFGRYPRREGIGSLVGTYEPPGPANPTPSRNTPSLASLLASRGYLTAWVGKWHLGQAGLSGALADREELGPFVHGFADWLEGSPVSIVGGGGTSYSSWHRVQDGASSISTVYNTTAQVDGLIAWWNASIQADPTRPRFAVLALNAAHEPLDRPPASLLPPGYVVGPTNRDRFEAILKAADHELGRLTSTLDLDDTYVFLVGDNGTDAASVPSGVDRSKVKNTTFEGGVRIPFLVVGPGIVAQLSERLVHVIDIPATIACMLEAEHGFLDSVSFADEFGFPGCALPRERLFVERYGASRPQDDQAAIEARWKLRVFDPDGTGPSAATERLYDLRSDPEESIPILPADQPAEYSRLKSFLDSLPPRLRSSLDQQPDR